MNSQQSLATWGLNLLRQSSLLTPKVHSWRWEVCACHEIRWLSASHRNGSLVLASRSSLLTSLIWSWSCAKTYSSSVFSSLLMNWIYFMAKQPFQMSHDWSKEKKLSHDWSKEKKNVAWQNINHIEKFIAIANFDFISLAINLPHLLMMKHFFEQRWNIFLNIGSMIVSLRWHI